MQIPKPITDKLAELNELVTKHPKYIPLTVCAAFLESAANEDLLLNM